MPNKQAQLKALMLFIREKRSNEINFKVLLDKLSQECKKENNATTDEAFLKSLEEVRDKYAIEYINSKEIQGNAWPEFEKFVSAFEKAITSALSANVDK